jgi:hypothetical protein
MSYLTLFDQLRTAIERMIDNGRTVEEVEMDVQDILSDFDVTSGAVPHESGIRDPHRGLCAQGRLPQPTLFPRLKLEAAEQDLADVHSSATHEAESLRQHIEDAHKAMGVIASSYAAKPYQDDETIPGTSLPTNRRIAREFLTYELPGDEA